MGVLGGLVSAPNYAGGPYTGPLQQAPNYNQLQQAAAQSQLQQALAQNHLQQAGSWHHALSPQPTLTNGPFSISVSGLETKVQEKIREAIAQLPMKICARIASIQFYPNHPTGGMRFVVVFDTQHRIDFPDVDEFPAPEHIARIALECP